MTLKPGDKVVFNTTPYSQMYVVKSEEYQYKGKGRKVVDLEGYAGEVAVEYLSKMSLSGKK
jgi:hypothetical protein